MKYKCRKFGCVQCSTKSILVTVRLSAEQKTILDAAAKKYMGGNLSEWLRYAGAEFKPKKR